MSKSKNNPIISKKDLPAPVRKHRYYTPDEVKVHNTANDCYVSIFYEIFDLTKYIQENYYLLKLIYFKYNNIYNYTTNNQILSTNIKILVKKFIKFICTLN